MIASSPTNGLLIRPIAHAWQHRQPRRTAPDLLRSRHSPKPGFGGIEALQAMPSVRRGIGGEDEWFWFLVMKVVQHTEKFDRPIDDLLLVDWFATLAENRFEIVVVVRFEDEVDRCLMLEAVVNSRGRQYVSVANNGASR